MKIQLKYDCISKVPLNNYINTFTFYVNGTEFKTNRLISDLLSPKICKIHVNDPTFDTFKFNTYQKGNFSHILNLINFDQIVIPTYEIPFISEVIKILGTEFIDINDPTETDEITFNNVFILIQQHESNEDFYFKRLNQEIEFISSHFFELSENNEKELSKLQVSTLYTIFKHKKLQLKSEDQLLRIINKLYSIDSKYSILYETVFFNKVSSRAMNEFITVFNSNDITAETWQKLSKRLQQEIQTKEEVKSKTKRYIEKGKLFLYSQREDFKGIINYLRNQKNENEIDFTSSSIENNADHHHPRNVSLFENPSKNFCSENFQNSWICFDFKKHRIIPTEYTIRSRNGVPNWYHPKNWVIECSNDKDSWEIIDEEINCSFLNGKRLVHTFKIKGNKMKEFRYLRMRSTGEDWYGTNYLTFETFEIYGRLL